VSEVKFLVACFFVNSWTESLEWLFVKYFLRSACSALSVMLIFTVCSYWFLGDTNYARY